VRSRRQRDPAGPLVRVVVRLAVSSGAKAVFGGEGEVISLITRASADELKIASGGRVMASVKATALPCAGWLRPAEEDPWIWSKSKEEVEKAAIDKVLHVPRRPEPLAERLGVDYIVVGTACNEAGIKVRVCELGCF